MGTALICLLLLGDATDQEFLRARMKELAARYGTFARSQSDTAVRARHAVVRELRHLPFTGEARTRAGALLARIVLTDRSYRVRGDAARAIGRVGTPAALEAMIEALFGSARRSKRFALLHAVLPEALASLRHPDGLEWLSLEILRPAARGAATDTMRAAGPLQPALVAGTIEGVGLARARALAPDLVALAASPSAPVRAAAVGALVAMDFHHDIVERSLTDPSEHVRAAAAAYPVLPPQLAADIAGDRSVRVRRAAIRGLGARDPVEGVPMLLRRLQAEDDVILRLEIADALNRLTGKEFGTDHGLWRAWWNANRQKFRNAGRPDPSGRTYFFELGLRTRRVLFVIDVSASMSREDERLVSRLEYAARELTSAVGKLPNEARFRVLAYAGEIRRFPERKPGDKLLAREAGVWLRGLKPAGSTNTYGALMEALSDPLRPDAIVLLSDGNPYRCTWKGKNYSEHEQILAEVRRVNRHDVKIHTVALLSGAMLDGDDEDAGAASDFLRRLAARNRGEFREVR